MDQPVYIVDIFREIVAAVSTKITSQLQLVQSTITGVHYLVGHVTEIKGRLHGLSQMQLGKYDRYPLIALFQDFPEYQGDGSGYYCSTTLQIMILYHTKKESYTEERYDSIFRPILYPIFYEFINQLVRHKSIVVQTPSKLPRTKIDRPHWGKDAQYGKDGYILDDVLDGIEIRDLKLTIKQNCI